MIVYFEDGAVFGADLTPVDDVTADVAQAGSIREGEQDDHLISSTVNL